MLIFGIGGIIGLLASVKIGMVFIATFTLPLRFVGLYFWRPLGTTIANHQTKAGYYFKGLAIVSGVVGMSMIVLMNPEKADMSEWIRNILFPAAILFWLLGAAAFIAGDVLVRRGRKAKQKATR